jgi:hypothetical protein
MMGLNLGRCHPAAHPSNSKQAVENTPISGTLTDQCAGSHIITIEYAIASQSRTAARVLIERKGRRAQRQGMEEPRMQPRSAAGLARFR